MGTVNNTRPIINKNNKNNKSINNEKIQFVFVKCESRTKYIIKTI